MTRNTAIRFLLVPFAAATCVAGKELAKKDLRQLLQSAASPKDHVRLAEHFEAKAQRYEADAAEHADSAKAYRARPTGIEQKHPMAPETAAHCEYLAESLTKAAKEARALGAAHRAMAAAK